MSTIPGFVWISSGIGHSGPFRQHEDESLNEADQMLAVRALCKLLREQDEPVVVIRGDDPPTPDLWVERTQDENGIPITIISIKGDE